MRERIEPFVDFFVALAGLSFQTLVIAWFVHRIRHERLELIATVASVLLILLFGILINLTQCALGRFFLRRNSDRNSPGLSPHRTQQQSSAESMFHCASLGFRRSHSEFPDCRPADQRKPSEGLLVYLQAKQEAEAHVFFEPHNVVGSPGVVEEAAMDTRGEIGLRT